MIVYRLYLDDTRKLNALAGHISEPLNDEVVCLELDEGATVMIKGESIISIQLAVNLCPQ